MSSRIPDLSITRSPLRTSVPLPRVSLPELHVHLPAGAIRTSTGVLVKYAEPCRATARPRKIPARSGPGEADGGSVELRTSRGSVVHAAMKQSNPTGTILVTTRHIVPTPPSVAADIALSIVDRKRFAGEYEQREDVMRAAHRRNVLQNNDIVSCTPLLPGATSHAHQSRSRRRRTPFPRAKLRVAGMTFGPNMGHFVSGSRRSHELREGVHECIAGCDAT
jgi:hypothetical protein